MLQKCDYLGSIFAHNSILRCDYAIECDVGFMKIIFFPLEMHQPITQWERKQSNEFSFSRRYQRKIWSLRLEPELGRMHRRQCTTGRWSRQHVRTRIQFRFGWRRTRRRTSRWRTTCWPGMFRQFMSVLLSIRMIFDHSGLVNSFRMIFNQSGLTKSESTPSFN